jgi:8-oxo-dGTP diphosphatase
VTGRITLDNSLDTALHIRMLQFGTKLPGKSYIPRPGGYAVVFDSDQRILAVSDRGKYFLPGGGVEAGESAEAAVIREAIEETGMTIRIVREIGRANEYIHAPSEDGYYNKMGTFYLAEIVDISGHTIPEEYPVVVWISIDEFERRAAHDSHVWAVRQAIMGNNHSPEPDRS